MPIGITQRDKDTAAYIMGSWPWLADQIAGAIAAERERCAVIAETVDVPHNGHPQMDPATIGDARRVIAATIRGTNSPG